MIELDEDFKQRVKTAYDNGEYKDNQSNFAMELAEDNPNSSSGDIRRTLRAFIKTFKSDSNVQLEEGSEKNLTKFLKQSFQINGKRLTVDKLRDNSFSAGKLTLLSGAPSNLDSQIDLLNVHAKETGDTVLMKNVRELGRFYVDYIADKTSTKGVVRIDFGWSEEVGDLPLGKFATRQRVYDYWAGIHGKHEAVLEATENLISSAKELEVHEDSVFAEGAMIKDYLKYVGELEKVYNEGIPNYVLQLPAFVLKTPDAFNSAIQMLDKFLDFKGVTGEEEEEGEVDEGDDQPVTEANPQDRSLPAPKRLKSPSFELTSEVEVDPIFWYDYNKEYDGVKIPKVQIDKVREALEGYSDRGGFELSGLSVVYLNDEHLDEFDKWFDGYSNMVSQTSSKSDKFFLPISPFIEKYMDAADYGSEGGTKSVSIINPKMNDLTLKFLEAISELIEVQKTQFSVYNKNIPSEEKGHNLGLGMQSAGAKTGKDRPTPLTDIFGSKPEKKIMELDSIWNDLLTALNDYYLLPMQGKNYVQAKEKPRWAKSHASLVLTIKNAKRNPLGSLLDRMVTEGVEVLKPSHMNNIAKFIEEARTGGVKRFKSSIWKYGQKAVKALDAIFGKEFHQKNMESIGYIIYDMGKKLDAKSIIDNPPKYWSEVEKLHANKGSEIYPIDQLRHALNTPEFTAWMGLSDDRNQSLKEPAPQYKNSKLAESVKALDAVFDTFHKMDVVNQALLHAHDSIRKMNNESTLYSNLSLTSIDHMDLVINKVHDEHRIDLTATEIDRMVKSVSSYKSIANNYGLNEEVVYTVKALFR